jgi:hypothetical protein
VNSYARASTAAGTAVAAVLTDQLWLLAVAAGVVAVAVTVIRIRWRRGRGLSDR